MRNAEDKIKKRIERLNNFILNFFLLNFNFSQEG